MRKMHRKLKRFNSNHLPPLMYHLSMPNNNNAGLRQLWHKAAIFEHSNLTSFPMFNEYVDCILCTGDKASLKVVK